MQKFSMSRPAEVEEFCRSFLLGTNYQHLYKLMGERSVELDSIDVHLFAADNFNEVFQNICGSLFAQRPASNSYILALLGFAVNIDRRLKGKEWYAVDAMISSLTWALLNVNFNIKNVDFWIYVRYYGL